MAEETIDKIGCAIRKGIKIAESSPKVDESQLNIFWKQTKYKSFPTFSKNYQRIDLKIKSINKKMDSQNEYFREHILLCLCN